MSMHTGIDDGWVVLERALEKEPPNRTPMEQRGIALLWKQAPSPLLELEWNRVSKGIDEVLYHRRHDESIALGREVQMAIWRKDFGFAERLLAQCVQHEERFVLDPAPAAHDRVTYLQVAGLVPPLASQLEAVRRGDRDAQNAFDATADAAFDELVGYKRQLWALQGQRDGHVSAARTPASTWTKENSHTAAAEGWGLFVSDTRGPMIERIDSTTDDFGKMVRPAFENDAAALGHVYLKAREGSRFHQQALLLTMADFDIGIVNEYAERRAEGNLVQLRDLCERAGITLVFDEGKGWSWSDEHGNEEHRIVTESAAALDGLGKKFGEAWRTDVLRGDTRRGFLDYVESELEQVEYEMGGMKP